MKDEMEFVPVNTEGKPLDLESKIEEKSLDEASDTYKRACKRLQNPRIWHEIAGNFSAKFELINENNVDPHRLVQLNDHLRIDIPGPGLQAGDGFDWVKVTKIAGDIVPGEDESFGIELRASSNPTGDSQQTAHFFTGEATSSFIISRKGTTITVRYAGRNEMPNTEDIKVADKIRNTLVASGAMVGISNIQWKALIDGLPKVEIGG